MNENYFETPLCLDDLYNAYTECRKNKRNKRAAKKFEVNALFNIQTLMDEINTKQYKLSPSQCFIITYPIAREVFCAAFRDRIVQHFVFNQLNPIIEKKLIYDSASCRKGKGTDFAIARVQRFLRSATDNYHENVYYLKMDLSGFFMRIDRDILFQKVKRIILEEYKGRYMEILLYLCEIIIISDVTKSARKLCSKELWNTLPARKTLFANKNGLPIGNICSQLFANYYMNDIDHFIKSRHRYYSRYVDDMIVVDENKKKLKETLKMVNEKLKTINMTLNDKTVIGHSEYGINYLGVIIYPYYTINGKKRIQRIMSSSYNDASEAYKSLCSRKGIFKHYHGKNLCHRFYDRLPNAIKERIVLCANLKAVLLEENTQNCDLLY